MSNSVRLNTGLLIGDLHPIRINCNVGCNDVSDYQDELQKLRILKEKAIVPDMMMDLSLVELENPLYLTIRDELGLPFGTVLSYQSFNKKDGLAWEQSRDNFIKLCENELSFITIHFTADLDILHKAKQYRKIPMTSRGGGLVLYDSILHSRKQNIYREHIDEIIEIALKYDVAISLGTTFRPATILDACDWAHNEESKRQLQVCKYLQKHGVKVIVENVGHISLNKLEKHAEILKSFNAPIMPLGPLPTDAAIGLDHISNAIGGAFASYLGIAHVINCVTRFEHSQAQITAAVTLEAIEAAKLAAHIADVSRHIPEAILSDEYITEQRSLQRNCFAGGESCSRCSSVCPLKIV